MDTTITASARPDTGKGVARKLRREGLVPAVLYADGTESRPLAVDPKALTDLFRHTRNRNTVVQLDFDGEKVEAIVKEVQRHPVSRELRHVDFLRVTQGKIIEVMVPVNPVGRPAGASLGGRIRLVRRDLKIRASYEHIPPTLDIDVTPLHIGDIVKASEIATPDGVSLVMEADFNVIACYGKKQKG